MVSLPYGVLPSTHVVTNQVPSNKLGHIVSSKPLARSMPQQNLDQNSYTPHYHEDLLSPLITLYSSPSHEVGARSSFKPLRMSNHAQSCQVAYVGQTNTFYQPNEKNQIQINFHQMGPQIISHNFHHITIKVKDITKSWLNQHTKNNQGTKCNMWIN